MAKSKYFFLSALILSLFLSPSTASPYVINLPYTSDEKSFTYDNNIWTEFKTSQDNAITGLTIQLEDNYSNTGVSISLSPYTTYNVTSYKPFWFYKEIEHTLKIGDQIIFDQTITEGNLIPASDWIQIHYDLATQNTTFCSDCWSWSVNMYNSQTIFVSEFPSSDITITGITNFSVKVTIQNIPNKIKLNENIESLSWLSGFIYNVLTVKIPLTEYRVLGDSQSLIKILQVFDVFLFIISIVFGVIFTYPYVIGIYIQTFGNFVGAVKGRSHREMLTAMIDYYKFVGRTGFGLFKFIIYNILKLFHAIANMLQIFKFW